MNNTLTTPATTPAGLYGTTFKVYQSRANSRAGIAIAYWETEAGATLLFQDGGQAEFSRDELARHATPGPRLALSYGTSDKLMSDYCQCIARAERPYFKQLFRRVEKALN